MQLNYRTKEQIIKDFAEQTEYLESSLDWQPEGMSDFFEKRLPSYDKSRKDWLDEYASIPDYLPKKFMTMLNVGCGCGFEFNGIFAKYPDISVTGIDMCKPMLDTFQNKFKNYDINLIHADYFKYPFEKEQYDVVLSVQSLHHFKYEKKKEIYRKIYNATKQGGYYFEFDYMAINDAYEKLNMDYYEKRRKKYNIPDDVFVHIDIPLTVEHQMELLKYAGFKKIEVLDKPFLESYMVSLKATK